MEFEIDVSGDDILSKNYTICIADRNGNSRESIIFGFKFEEGTIKWLINRHLQGLYKYGFSKSQKALLKIRLYCITIYYIIQQIQIKHPHIFDKGIYLTICRDFYGRENDIKSNLKYLLTDILKLEIKSMQFCKLPDSSNADHYAYFMRNDKRNLMKQNYVKITKEDFERFLKK